jgi:hypothetical protein
MDRLRSHHPHKHLRDLHTLVLERLVVVDLFPAEGNDRRKDLSRAFYLPPAAAAVLESIWNLHLPAFSTLVQAEGPRELWPPSPVPEIAAVCPSPPPVSIYPTFPLVAVLLRVPLALHPIPSFLFVVTASSSCPCGRHPHRLSRFSRSKSGRVSGRPGCFFPSSFSFSPFLPVWERYRHPTSTAKGKTQYAACWVSNSHLDVQPVKKHGKLTGS